MEIKKHLLEVTQEGAMSIFFKERYFGSSISSIRFTKSL
jgi:hypothetical protein